MNAMWTFPKSAITQSEGARVLANILDKNKKAMDLILIRSGVICLTTAIINHPNHMYVHECTLEVLARLVAGACHNVTVTSHAREITLVMFKSMMTHPSSCLIQSLACWIISWLASLEHVHTMLLEKGAIDAVFSAMRAHHLDAAVQANGCWALSVLAQHTEARQMIVDHGGVHIILRAMRNHQEIMVVQKYAVRALEYLVLEPTALMVVAAQNGIEDLEMMAVRHPILAVTIGGLLLACT